jgi:hypothetical protein
MKSWRKKRRLPLVEADPPNDARSEDHRLRQPPWLDVHAIFWSHRGPSQDDAGSAALLQILQVSVSSRGFTSRLSPYEANFVSSAHTDEQIERTCQACLSFK